jgi:dTDP-4-dehydrorhamnose reductase
MRLYVTGGTGFVGSNIIKVAIERYQAEIFTTVHSWHAEVDVPFTYGQVDMLDRNRVFETVRRFAPDAIIHSAILNDLGVMYRDRKLAWQSYVDATRSMTEAANQVGAKMILVSTDWVFDGTQSGADETTPPNPVNYYGVLKAICETVVRETAKNGAVARVSGVSGKHWLRPDLPRSQDLGFGYLVKTVVDALRKNVPVTVWEAENINMIGTPSLASESAEMLLRIIARDKQGVFHCCGGESISRMGLAHTAAEVFDLDASLLQSGKPDWGDLAGVSIPYDTSLSATYTAEQLDYQLPTIRQLLQTYRHQVETGML